MRISTITNWAYGITVLLTGLSGAAFLMSVHSAQVERAAVETHLTFDAFAEDLAVAVEELTDEARLYAVRGDARHLNAYRYEAGVTRPRDLALKRARTMGAAPSLDRPGRHDRLALF